MTKQLGEFVKRTLHDFYSDFVYKHGWSHIAPLLDVISVIESEIQKRNLTKFTSHEMLCVSSQATYPEWFDDDILFIVPDRSGVARVLFRVKEDRDKMGPVDFLEKGGTAVPYEELLLTIIPHLEKLAQRKGD